jgi:hypothetical protein
VFTSILRVYPSDPDTILILSILRYTTQLCVVCVKIDFHVFVSTHVKRETLPYVTPCVCVASAHTNKYANAPEERKRENALSLYNLFSFILIYLARSKETHLDKVLVERRASQPEFIFSPFKCFAFVCMCVTENCSLIFEFSLSGWWLFFLQLSRFLFRVRGAYFIEPCYRVMICHK